MIETLEALDACCTIHPSVHARGNQAGELAVMKQSACDRHVTCVICWIFAAVLRAFLSQDPYVGAGTWVRLCTSPGPPHGAPTLGLYQPLDCRPSDTFLFYAALLICILLKFRKKLDDERHRARVGGCFWRGRPACHSATDKPGRALIVGGDFRVVTQAT